MLPYENQCFGMKKYIPFHTRYENFVISHTWYEMVWESMGMKRYETVWNNMKRYEMKCMKYVPVYTGTYFHMLEFPHFVDAHTNTYQHMPACNWFFCFLNSAAPGWPAWKRHICCALTTHDFKHIQLTFHSVSRSFPGLAPTPHPPSSTPLPAFPGEG